MVESGGLEKRLSTSCKLNKIHQIRLPINSCAEFDFTGFPPFSSALTRVWCQNGDSHLKRTLQRKLSPIPRRARFRWTAVILAAVEVQITRPFRRIQGSGQNLTISRKGDPLSSRQFPADTGNHPFSIASVSNRCREVVVPRGSLWNLKALGSYDFHV